MVELRAAGAESAATANAARSLFGNERMPAQQLADSVTG